MTQSKALRRVLVAAFMSTIVVGTGRASADEREQCAAAADQAQQLRDDGKYRRAREQMLICARDACPGPIKSDCGKWLDDLDRDAPTVVIGAKSGTQDVTDVKVSIDHVVVTEKLDGKPMMVDSGEHTFKFEYQGQIKEERVLLRATEKARLVTMIFGPATPPKPPPPPPKPPATTEEPSLVPAIVIGGIGVLAIGSFALFGIQGKNKVADLQKCSPRCAESDVDKARTKLIIADISLGVGVVALGIAAYMILTRPKAEAKVAPRGANATKRANVTFDFGPVQGGGAAALSGKF